MLRAARCPAAIASMAVHGPLAAASPPANTPFLPVPSVVLSVTIWSFSTRCRRRRRESPADQTLADGEDYGVAVELVLRAGDGDRRRQPRASGCPASRRETRLWRRAVGSFFDRGRHARAVEAMSSSRPSPSSSSEAGTLWSSSMQLMVTLAAPRRRAAAASKARRAADDDNVLAYVDLLAERGGPKHVDGVEDALGVGAGIGSVRPPCRPTARYTAL